MLYFIHKWGIIMCVNKYIQTLKEFIWSNFVAQIPPVRKTYETISHFTENVIYLYTHSIQKIFSIAFSPDYP